MNRKFVLAALACTALSSPAFAQDTVPVADEAEGEGAIVVTAARTTLPPNALPLTIDVISQESLDQQVAVSGSVIDAVARYERTAMTPKMASASSASISVNPDDLRFVIISSGSDCRGSP